MNNHAKRAIKELESIGFMRDYDHPSKKARAYRHPNQPDEVLKVFDAMTDNSLTMVIRKANKIADTGWSGPRQPQTVRERANIQRRKAKTKREREDAARRERAEKAEAEHQVREKLAEELRRRREIEDLMRHGYGR